MRKSRTDYNVSLLRARVEQHITKHDGVRNFAKVLGVDPSYVTRLRQGKKKEPSDKILRKLKLTRMVVYADDGSNDVNHTHDQ